MDENRSQTLEARHGRKRKKVKTEEIHTNAKDECKSIQIETINFEKKSNTTLPPSSNVTSVESNCASNNNANVSYVRTKTDKRGNCGGNNNNNNKFNFRAPQQFQLSKKKNWNKRHQKGLHGNPVISGLGVGGSSSGVLHLQQIIKADVENLPNIKNQISHHRQGGCNNAGSKNMKQQCYTKKKILGGVGSGILSIRSKFFLSDKRPRKEIIIPPTKFLLGGNISDPLNLNSLQEEAQSGNATPSTTPRQSPVTTPPKIEVIIPPNIHDPLHLLDPVDSIEYEKQLVSPMKRRHRHRKKKQKRKRLNSANSCVSTVPPSSELNFTNALSSLLHSDKDDGDKEINETKKNYSTLLNDNTKDDNNLGNTENLNSRLIVKIDNVDNKTTEILKPVDTEHEKNECDNSLNNFGIEKRRSEQFERVSKELKLDLDISAEQHKLNMMNIGRKRKSSEAGSCKNKFRRLDSMDKIVSPVVPQPGAWKRPPRNTPTGARKGSRMRSISNSEPELNSPTEEVKLGLGLKQNESNEGIDKKLNAKISDRPVVESTDDANIQEKCDKEINIENKTSKSLPSFRPDGIRYQYGNYDRYSGFNSVNEFIDIRLQVFQRNPELFVNKDILDIGCNVGHMTIAVAKKLFPKSIIGIDIDSKLISRARRNISLYVKIPKEEDDDNSSKFIKGTDLSATNIAPDDNKNALDEKLKMENFKELLNKQLVELQKNLNDSNKTISKSKIKRKIYFELRRKNKFLQKQHFAEQRRIEGRSVGTFPISFPICYGPIPSTQTTKFFLSSPRNVSDGGCSSTGPNNDSLASGSGLIGNSNSNIGTNQSCTSASVTPIRNSGASGGAASNSNLTEIKSIQNEFPKNIFFRQSNYVLKDENAVNNEIQQYDLILCLSVTKWIHLNFGDTGLKLAFKRMFNQLRPGGKLILEAQNWASYKKKKRLTETIYKNYNSIEFFPNKFHEYLLSNEVGFSHSYTLGVPRHLSKGFCRPIQLYAKGDFTPNHVRWSDAYNPQTPYEAYRGIYASVPRPPYPLWGSWDLIRTPRGNSSSCRQTPYYNPLESDSYLPSYDTEVLNRHYVFASPLYQTIWSPPASLRNSSSHTPVYGSIREVDNENASVSSSSRTKHVYLPNDESNSPKIVNGAFNSIREETDQDSNSPARQHVYANCDSSSSPKDGGSDNDQIQHISSTVSGNNSVQPTGERSQENVSDSNDSEII